MAQIGHGDLLASACAQEAHENHFRLHHGVFCVQDEDDPGDEGTLVIFNNHPYARDPLRREKEIAEIRSRLRAGGIPELAFATYPCGGPADGYSYAMVLGASAGWIECVSDLVNDALVACDRERGS